MSGLLSIFCMFLFVRVLAFGYVDSRCTTEFIKLNNNYLISCYMWNSQEDNLFDVSSSNAIL